MSIKNICKTSNDVTTEKNKIYDMLNVFRFVSAILVICIHTVPLKNINSEISFILNMIVARIAVPFFFTSSGYLFYSKFKENDLYIKGYIIRILYIYLGWSCIYFFPNIIVMIKNQVEIKQGIIQIVINLLFRGSYFHLWYLVSLIYSVIFISIFLKRNRMKILIILSFILFIIGVLGDTYFKIIENTYINQIINVYNILFGVTRNGICFGVPFMTIGVAIYKYKLEQKLYVKNKLLIIFFIILLIEGYIVKKLDIARDYNMYFTLIPLVFLIFIRILNSSINIKDKYSRKFKQLGLGIYCCHGIFLIMFREIYIGLGVYDYKYRSLLNFCLVTICSILMTQLLIKSRVKAIRVLVT